MNDDDVETTQPAALIFIGFIGGRSFQAKQNPSSSHRPNNKEGAPLPTPSFDQANK